MRFRKQKIFYKLEKKFGKSIQNKNMQQHIRYVNLFLNVIDELTKKNNLSNILTKVYRKRFKLKVNSSIKIQKQFRKYIALKQFRKLIAKKFLHEIIIKVQKEKEEREIIRNNLLDELKKFYIQNKFDKMNNQLDEKNSYIKKREGYIKVLEYKIKELKNTIANNVMIQSQQKMKYNNKLMEFNETKNEFDIYKIKSLKTNRTNKVLRKREKKLLDENDNLQKDIEKNKDYSTLYRKMAFNIIDGIYLKKHNKNLKYSSICKLWYAKEDNEKYIVWKADTKIMNKLPTYINITNIINIEKGIKTQVLYKSVEKEKENLCFSIITLERSYDFECSSEKIRDLLIDFINRKIKKIIIEKEETQLLI